MHSYCTTCAFMHNFTLTDVGVFFFLSKWVKWGVFSTLQDFLSIDVDALRLDLVMTSSFLHGSQYVTNFPTSDVRCWMQSSILQSALKIWKYLVTKP